MNVEVNENMDSIKTFDQYVTACKEPPQLLKVAGVHVREPPGGWEDNAVRLGWPRYLNRIPFFIYMNNCNECTNFIL